MGMGNKCWQHSKTMLGTYKTSFTVASRCQCLVQRQYFGRGNTSAYVISLEEVKLDNLSCFLTNELQTNNKVLRF